MIFRTALFPAGRMIMPDVLLSAWPPFSANRIALSTHHGRRIVGKLRHCMLFRFMGDIPIASSGITRLPIAVSDKNT